METPAQREILKALGCREMQGFLLGRPVSAERIRELGAAVS
ncbi:signaling protein [Bordetella pertussis]|nr:signaling protein [Bordetella pertussis]